MRSLERTNTFKRDFKKHGDLSTALIEVLYLLLNDKPLPQQYKDHELIGKVLENVILSLIYCLFIVKMMTYYN